MYIENVIVQFLELPSVLGDAFAVMKLEFTVRCLKIKGALVGEERCRHADLPTDVDD